MTRAVRRWSLLAASLLVASCSADPPPPADATVDANTDVGVTTDIAPVDRALSTDRGVDAGTDTLLVDDLSTDAPVMDVPDASVEMDRQVPRCEPNTYAPCVCPTGQDGTQRCNVVGVYEPCRCGLPMDAGADVVDAPDVVDVPPRDVPPLVLPARLLLPRSVSRATTQRPTFRWVLPTGVTRARLTLARDRALTREPRTVPVEGDRWRATAALSPGVWFWRVEGLDADGGVSWTSPTWEFFSPRRDSPVDSSWGASWNFDGDGYDDLLMLEGPRWVTYPGSPTGPDLTRPRRADWPPEDPSYTGDFEVGVGDFNGDGLGDALVTVNGGALPDMQYQVRVYYGGPTGLEVSPRTVLNTSSLVPEEDAPLARVQAMDWDGDGYTDAIIGLTYVTCGEGDYIGFEVHRGGPEGVAATPSFRFLRNRAAGYPCHGFVRALGDIDADGYGDVAIAVNLRGDRYSAVVYGAPVDAPQESLRVVPRPSRDENSNLRVSPVGDMNGDGLLEVAFGDLNQIAIYSGRFEAGSSPLAVISAPDLPSARYVQNSFGNYFGQPCDINGDGLADMVAASPAAPVTPTFSEGSGRVYVFHGRASGWATTADLTFAPEVPPHWTIEFGLTMQTAGDTNGDGFSDLIAASDDSSGLRGWYGGTGPFPTLAPFVLRSSDAGGRLHLFVLASL